MLKFTDSDYNLIRRNRKGTLVLGTGPNDKGTANWIVGGISKPSKMPGPSFNLTTDVCHVGGKLRNVKGSVCEGCYADKRGRYAFDSVYDAGMRRLFRLRQALKDSTFRVLYVEAWKDLLANASWMRWHDAGDLISTDHLGIIVEIAEQSPHCNHWLPTKEYKRVLTFLNSGVIPGNLNVRVSGYMVDDVAPVVADGLTTSTVTSETKGKGRQCPAVINHTSCNGVPLKDPKGKALHKPCRACWSSRVKNVNYGLHTAKVSTPCAADREFVSKLWDFEAFNIALEKGQSVAV
jgi:hypothetical protein